MFTNRVNDDKIRNRREILKNDLLNFESFDKIYKSKSKTRHPD